MNCLTTKSFIGSTDKLCRLYNSYNDTGRHILNNCKLMLQLKTKRHDNIQDLISKCFSLINISHNITPNHYPDIVIETSKGRIVIDVTIPFDEIHNIEQAHEVKVKKYEDLGTVLPFIISYLGSWYISNDPH